MPGNKPDAASDGMVGERILARRDAVMNALGAIAGFITAALSVPLVTFLFGPVLREKATWSLSGEAVPPTSRPRDPWVRVGELSGLPPDRPSLTMVSVPVQDGWITADTPVAVYISRDGNERPTIFDIHCTHVGCPVRWNGAARRFFCPCHGGVFDEAGRVLSGPPPRPLDQYAVKVDAGVVYMGALKPPAS